MSARNFLILDRNDHGLYPLVMRMTTQIDMHEVEESRQLAELTLEELESIERQAHERRAEV